MHRKLIPRFCGGSNWNFLWLKPTILRMIFKRLAVRELTPQISQSRNFPPALSSMKIWSNRAIKTALRSVRCPLQRIKISAKSAYNFMKWWALQLSDYRRSGTGQKFNLRCQLSMESQHSNCIESIKRHFYNIPPISGSLHLVLTCPDVEIPP